MKRNILVCGVPDKIAAQQAHNDKQNKLQDENTKTKMTHADEPAGAA